MGSHLLSSNKTEVLLMNKIKNTEQERSIKRILRWAWHYKCQGKKMFQQGGRLLKSRMVRGGLIGEEGP